MQRMKYAVQFKGESVKQVLAKGHAVVDVAKRLGISEGVLYGWVKKIKKSDAPQSSDLKLLQAEMVKLKGELRQTTEVLGLLKRPQGTLTSSQGEVRVHADAAS